MRLMRLVLTGLLCALCLWQMREIDKWHYYSELNWALGAKRTVGFEMIAEHMIEKAFAVKYCRPDKMGGFSFYCLASDYKIVHIIPDEWVFEHKKSPTVDDWKPKWDAFNRENPTKCTMNFSDYYQPRANGYCYAADAPPDKTTGWSCMRGLECKVISRSDSEPSA